MVSRPTCGTNFCFTACSAIRRTVHRAAPGGGALQTMAMIRCLSEAVSTSAAQAAVPQTRHRPRRVVDSAARSGESPAG